MRVLVTGATGFLGSHVCTLLKRKGFEVLETSLSLHTDLTDRSQAMAIFEKLKPETVIHCAAFVGGIQFGLKYPADLFRKNIEMGLNVLEACRQFGVKRLITPIPNCAYPGHLTTYNEKDFWNGRLHESVESYGLAKKAIYVGAVAYQKQYQLDSITFILPNMYGPKDHFDEERSHALGALVSRIYHAKERNQPSVSIWGTGKPVREWLFVEDGAEILTEAIDAAPYGNPINVGVSKGISIGELAKLIKEAVSYPGELEFDLSKPDGALSKIMDASVCKKLFNWAPKVGLNEGLKKTVEWYIQHAVSYEKRH